METRTKVPSRPQGRGWVYLTLILWTLSRLDATLAATSNNTKCSDKPLTLKATNQSQEISQTVLTGSSTCKWLIKNDNNNRIHVSSAVLFKPGCKNDAVQVYDGKDSSGDQRIDQKCPKLAGQEIETSSNFVYVEVKSFGGFTKLNITYWATSGVPPVTRCSIGVMAGVILGLMLRF